MMYCRWTSQFCLRTYSVVYWSGKPYWPDWCSTDWFCIHCIHWPWASEKRDLQIVLSNVIEFCSVDSGMCKIVPTDSFHLWISVDCGSVREIKIGSIGGSGCFWIKLRVETNSKLHELKKAGNWWDLHAKQPRAWYWCSNCACLSVDPSVHLSVTLLYCVKTFKFMVEILSQPYSAHK